MPPVKSKREIWFKGISWLVTVALATTMIALTLLHPNVNQWWQGSASADADLPTAIPTEGKSLASVSHSMLPDYNASSILDAINLEVNVHTTIPTDHREKAVTYTVESGDSLFAIAKQFGVSAETILWANYDTLKDNADSLSIGQVLTIPPTDGIYYKWQEGDTIDSVASKYDAKSADIISYIGNNLDITDPKIKSGTYVMVPGGSRSLVQWIVPTIARGKSGTASVTGGCSSSVDGYYGTGSFIWPTGNHYLSGNDYSSYHLGIDIAASMGSPVWAADTGIVVYAAWNNQGYGNMVMIDHGDGYQTLYGHLSQIMVSCGSGVIQGQEIALSGSTGNSTGPHLHFEVRLNGGFVDPWYVLP